MEEILHQIGTLKPSATPSMYSAEGGAVFFHQRYEDPEA